MLSLYSDRRFARAESLSDVLKSLICLCVLLYGIGRAAVSIVAHLVKQSVLMSRSSLHVLVYRHSICTLFPDHALSSALSIHA